MNQKTYFQVTGLIFTAAAFVHLLRLLMGWPVSIAGNNIPILASLVILGVSGYLAYSAYKLMK